MHVIKEAKIVNNGPVASVALYMDKMEETTVFDIYELALEAMTDFPTLRLSDMKVASAGNTHTVGQQAVVFDWPVEDLLASYGVRRIFR